MWVTLSSFPQVLRLSSKTTVWMASTDGSASWLAFHHCGQQLLKYWESGTQKDTANDSRRLRLDFSHKLSFMRTRRKIEESCDYVSWWIDPALQFTTANTGEEKSPVSNRTWSRKAYWRQWKIPINFSGFGSGLLVFLDKSEQNHCLRTDMQYLGISQGRKLSSSLVVLLMSLNLDWDHTGKKRVIYQSQWELHMLSSCDN